MSEQARDFFSKEKAILVNKEKVELARYIAGRARGINVLLYALTR